MNPLEVKQDGRQMLESAGMGHTSRDFFRSCRPFHSVTERPVAGRFEYQSRMQASCAAWLRMSKKDRDILTAGAGDKVYWRGEPVAQYQDIWNETMRMREIGRDAYIAEAKAKMGGLER